MKATGEAIKQAGPQKILMQPMVAGQLALSFTTHGKLKKIFMFDSSKPKGPKKKERNIEKETDWDRK